MNRLTRKLLAGAAAASLLAGVAGIASADTIHTSDDVTKTAGSTGVATIRLVPGDNGDPVNGCNASVANPVTVAVASDNLMVTVDAPGTVEVTGCNGETDEKTIGYSVDSDAPVDTVATITASAATGTASAPNGVVASGNGQNAGTTYYPSYTGNSFTVTVVAADPEVNPCDAVLAPDAPVFSHTATGNLGWDTTIPTVSASSTGATVTYSTTAGGPYGAAPTLTDGQTTVYAIATEASCSKVSAESSELYKVDTADPTVTFTGGPTDGASYYFGFVPLAPTCSAVDPTPGSGLTGSCVVSGYGTTVGVQTVTGSQSDLAGNLGSSSRNYTVLAWTLTGFYSPVDMGGVYNVVKGGSTVPLKFEVFAGPTELTTTSAVQSFVQTKVACDGAATTDEVEVVSTGGTSLRYDSTGGQFIQNWQTPKLPGQCYRVTMTTSDGSSLVAFFKLK